MLLLSPEAPGRRFISEVRVGEKIRREVQPRTPRRFNTAESSSAAQPTPRVPLLCVPGLLRVCPFEGSGEYSVSCSMLRPGRPVNDHSGEPAVQYGALAERGSTTLIILRHSRSAGRAEA